MDIPQDTYTTDPRPMAGTGMQQGLTSVTDGTPHMAGTDAQPGM